MGLFEIYPARTGGKAQGVSLLASCQDVGRPHRNDQTVAVRPGTCVSQISLERASPTVANRLVRTRMSGGVGGGSGNAIRYPDLGGNGAEARV